MFHPIFFMMLLTFIIGTLAVRQRVNSVKTKQVSIKYFQLMDGENVPDHIVRMSRSFNNQFEMPVLFYVVCLVYLHFQIESLMAVSLAWTFVVIRYIHAYIHIVYNNVLHRMISFWLSSVCLLGLLINLLFYVP